MRRLLYALGLIVPVAATLGVLGCKDSQNSASRLSGGGSTFVDPIMQKWSSEYTKAKSVEIDYSKTGSSDGIKQMTDKNLDFGCSDAPMKKDQYETAKAKGGEVIHIPLIMGAVAIVYHVPNVADLKLSGSVLADIYLNKIQNWNDKAIAALNPGVALPDLRIVQVYRSEGSGTSNIFTEYLGKASSAFAQKIPASTQPKWPEMGLGQKGSDSIRRRALAVCQRSTPEVNQVQFWLNGTWITIPAYSFELHVQGTDVHHSPDVLRLIRAGHEALLQGDTRAAIEKLRQALELDPRCLKPQ